MSILFSFIFIFHVYSFFICIDYWIENIVRLLRLLEKMDRSPARLQEDDAWLETILTENDLNLEPEDPHAADILAAKQAIEVAKDPNYVPSAEV